MGLTNEESKVAVAIEKNRGSQSALKWAIDHLLNRGQSVTLIHVEQKHSSFSTSFAVGTHEDDVANNQHQSQNREFFLPFRCFCTRKDIKCKEVFVEDMDVTKAIVDYVTANAIDNLVVGSPRTSFSRTIKGSVDISSTVSKAAPEFCTVYVISKGGHVSHERPATCSPRPKQTKMQYQSSKLSDLLIESPYKHHRTPRAADKSPLTPHNHEEDMEIKSPFNRSRGSHRKSHEPSTPDTNLGSYESSGRQSIDHVFPSYFTISESGTNSQFSNGSDYDYRSSGSSYVGNKAFDFSDSSSSSQESGIVSFASQNLEDAEAEMRRIKLELKQTMDLYSSACKERAAAEQKTRELHRWKLEEQKLQEARLTEETALALIEKERAKCKAAIEAAQRIAELEVQRRKELEMKALKESEEKKATESMAHNDIRYRRYTIEEIEAATQNFSNSFKIGEGGYGPVYRGYLDQTPVAIKVLRADAAQGRSQFQQEVEVLTCIRHPNMVLLLGACPEYGCLVYEYMANGSLDDRLFHRGKTPPLSWQSRFRIAAEIGTSLLFLHQTKPEPLVHRDLKPGNILLDHNYVSKISDVGLARLVPPSVANSVTQYLMTSTAGTFCYIDPEYQQTGMLGTKSDIYSLGVMLLQIITAKPPMGLTHHVEKAIEEGTFAKMLDPAVPDWPIEETLNFAKLALQCTELRRKDRPDLGKVVLPQLNRWRELAEENMP